MAISLKMRFPAAARLQSRTWTLWWILLVCVGLFHLLTLTISPTVWMDEVFTVEFGRMTLEPNTTWSIMWAGRPLLLFNYLGSTIQEIAFQLGHQSVMGPRLSSLIGGLLAATALFGYLLARQIPKTISFLLAFILLLEPMFVQSYRGGRVDSWAIAVCLLACWLLRVAINRGQNGKNRTKLVAMAGGLAVTSQFVWISALLLYPLILIEFLDLLKTAKGQRQGRQFVLRQILTISLGGILAGAILIVPILPHLGTLLSNMVTLSTNNQTLRDRSHFLGEIPWILNAVFSTYKLSPFLLPVVGLGVVLCRDRRLVLATFFMAALVFVTHVYQFRCIYLLPYFFLLLADPFHPSRRLSNVNIRRILIGALCVLVLWGSGLSLVVRPAIALNQSAGRAPTILCNAGMALVGAGAHNVYLGTPELYYAGRALGWKMYKLPDNSRVLAPQAGSKFSTLAQRANLPAIDYVVSIPNQLDANTEQIIQDFGLNKQKVFTNPATAQTNAVNLPGGAKPYSSFIVFSR
jgi:hypothetical protein